MFAKHQNLQLLPKEFLIKTGPVDHADWNYRPLLGAIQRLRFRLICSLLPDKPAARLLEVGYGSGVFMPELASRCRRLYGVDIHENTAQVATQLQHRQVAAELLSVSVEKMPFDDDFFDCVVAVSSLEFADNAEAACGEIRRVLKPAGSLVLVTPGKSALVDFGLKVLTGKSAKTDFDDRRDKLPAALANNFATEKVATFPPVGSSLVRLYTAFKLSPLPQ